MAHPSVISRRDIGGASKCCRDSSNFELCSLNFELRQSGDPVDFLPKTLIKQGQNIHGRNANGASGDRA
jgi:hypothetical protein